MEPAQVIAIPKVPKILPGRMILLTLLITLPFLALLVMEQGRVIDSQRLLIQQLVGDSLELNSMKVRDMNNNRQAQQSSKDKDKAAAQAPAGPQSRATQPGAAAKPKADEKKAPPQPQLPAIKSRDLSKLKAV
ncbi:MAG: hypothetical protein JOY79_08560 [Acidobacteriaceae bacterium]|nr:hypothetical protein [Acidobacteriaceae bacterium]